jgi:hypothetical protein
LLISHLFIPYIDLDIEKYLFPHLKPKTFMSGIQAPAWVVKLLIKYVTCFNFDKSINQSLMLPLAGKR